MEHPVCGESSTSNSTPKWEFDVFLSFAGKDTRLNFTDHLYHAFISSGIRCFKDDVDLPRGENINYLFQAIQNSLYAVLVISKNYAKSEWCLDELQKILEYRNALGLWVFPIFYDVKPADVRDQRESFGEALAELEEKFNTTKVKNWRTALSELGNLSGWVTRGRQEADLIKNIVGVVWTYLSSKLPSYHDHLVGIHSRVADMMPFLKIGLNDNRFVGMWGMGGVGKTTLARVVFDKLSHKYYEFEICCFLANVRGTLQTEGLVSLQKRLLSHLKIKNMKIQDDCEGMKMIRKLLCNKKVLLVLDDIDDVRQLKNLAESPYWFGEGSRIIITTRDSHVLTSSRVKGIYEMKTMKKVESLQLFSNKAFNKDHPQRGYLKLSKSVVKYAGGLPLALEVLGSFLCRRSKSEWIDALDRLKTIPNNNILQVLKISYDGLNEEEKIIFLDIACLFTGWQRKEVTQILESCDLHATIGIKVLIEKTLLVEMEDCNLDMHDLLKDLGRYIVEQTCPNVGKRSRLWKFEDIKDVLENNKGSEAIQAIVLRYHHTHPVKIKVHPKAILKMSNIRLLLFDCGVNNPLIFPRGLKHSGALKIRVVQWPSFPFKALPLPLDELFHIEMCFSNIKQLWHGIQLMKKLKFINLSFSHDFTETPDFSGVPYLEHLSLQCCTSLVKVHHSVGELKELVEVYLHGCYNLEILPRKLETNSLKKLDLSWCEKVALLPEFGEGMKKLSYLDVSYTSITRLPESLGFLTGLSDLNLSGCKILNLHKLSETHITHQISSLNVSLLRKLYLSGCGLNDRSIPDDFGSLSSLIVLDLSFNEFVNLPCGCFSSLFRLLFLSLDHCERLKSLPRLPPRLIQLNASRCQSMELLSDIQLWNLVASLDHECRGQTKYVISNEKYDDIPWEFKHVQLEWLPLRDFFAIMPGNRIPSWFPHQKKGPFNNFTREYVIKVNIPWALRDKEWCGIVVCLHISCFLEGMITWSSKAPEDDDCISNERADGSYFSRNYQNGHLCIMVLELNEETCWQHLRPHHNSLHIKLHSYYHSKPFPWVGGANIKILGCGWRVISKEEIQKTCNPFNDLNLFIQPQLATPNEVELPWTIFNDFLGEV